MSSDTNDCHKMSSDTNDSKVELNIPVNHLPETAANITIGIDNQNTAIENELALNV